MDLHEVRQASSIKRERDEEDNSKNNIAYSNVHDDKLMVSTS